MSDTSLNHLKSTGSAHYKGDRFEVFEVALEWDLDFFLGCTLKYIKRISRSDRPLTSRLRDIEKAMHYLAMEHYKLTEQGGRCEEGPRT